MSTRFLNTFSILLVIVSVGLLVQKNLSPSRSRPLLNVSYDPTREIYKQLNSKFLSKQEGQHGGWLGVTQSHGGSGFQAAAVANGEEADVVTLALPSDIDRLVTQGLVAADWKNRLPNESQPYYSTLVFVVRKGNPKKIQDWPDLVRPGVSVITPDPSTSGNGMLSVLGAWGSILYSGGTEEEARDFVVKLYQHVPVLGRGSRDASAAFVTGKVGDVHLAWENEAIREVTEAKGNLELVYPSCSIRAEPSVAWVDANVLKHHSETQARKYLDFLFTDEAQEILAESGYRSFLPEVMNKHRERLPDFPLFPITLVAKDWDDAQVKFFGENGVFAAIYPGLVR